MFYPISSSVCCNIFFISLMAVALSLYSIQTYQFDLVDDNKTASFAIWPPEGADAIEEAIESAVLRLPDAPLGFLSIQTNPFLYWIGRRSVTSIEKEKRKKKNSRKLAHFKPKKKNPLSQNANEYNIIADETLVWCGASQTKQISASLPLVALVASL